LAPMGQRCAWDVVATPAAPATCVQIIEAPKQYNGLPMQCKAMVWYALAMHPRLSPSPAKGEELSR
jgi:hypothetical protein